MAAILSNLRNTVIAGIVLTIIMVVIVSAVTGGGFDMGGHAYSAFIMRWLHVLSGVMWVGLLYYFNFVQIPNMPNIPDEQKPAIGKVIAPAALFWFRWAAMATIVTGLLLAMMNGYLLDALTLGAMEGFVVDKSLAIGIGMWLGIIMWFNVWFVIWPNQKKALGIVDADAATKAASARTAMLFSRTNTLLSIPMLYAMVSAQNLF
ncbi:urate hydroxylase PuuD [uncultured Sneathiella sp.]|uniref:urate hydroxylase PuuD n=1 Tax=uncultured Sneathiella sp. TaxID=879315 RepID=UPI0030EE1630|tara:strand:+ start:9656 stop:10270 length:615 start_codon:yes stop_codon:yes gene_type:complete